MERSRKALLVARACREMGLDFGHDSSVLSESEYVWARNETRFGIRYVQIRFSDHVLPERYWPNRPTFEVALTCGHPEAQGDCYSAIVWIAEQFETFELIPGWVIDAVNP